MRRIYSFFSFLGNDTRQQLGLAICGPTIRSGRPGVGSRISSRRGLTLIEMLVAVTITLMVVLAIVQVFQLLGTNIKEGQAIIDVTTELRFVAQQLQEDLDGLTCPARTWIDPAAGLGYLEIYDGPSWDANWNDNWTATNPPQPLLDLVDRNGDGSPDEDTSLGDVDDFIALTTRNTDLPFVGRVPVRDTDDTGAIGEFIGQAESRDAEVIWWTAIVATSNTYQNGNFVVNIFDLDGDGVATDAEKRQTTRLGTTTSVMLFRRPLLVSPGIDLSPIENPASPFENNTLGRLAQTLDDVLNFLDNYDVSVRWVDTDGDNQRDTLYANSLSDLTQRQNRFMHLDSDVFPPETNVRDPALAGFPFFFAQGAAGTPVRQSPPANIPLNGDLARVSYQNELNARRVRFARFPAVIPLRSLSLAAQNDYAVYTQLMARSSVADNILAFDIRCYDPQAPVFIRLEPNGTPAVPRVVLAPGDPAYPHDNDPSNPKSIRNLVGNNRYPLDLLGLGAYVDLNYAHGFKVGYINWENPLNRTELGYRDRNGNTLPVDSLFASASYGVLSKPQVLPRHYDVWSTQYERDGFDQDVDGFIDEGTNEVDDDGDNGVDDVEERETAPPYDVPLRGIKVTIRKMDYETRQTRQVSVVGDFVPE